MDGGIRVDGVGVGWCNPGGGGDLGVRVDGKAGTSVDGGGVGVVRVHGWRGEELGRLVAVDWGRGRGVVHGTYE